MLLEQNWEINCTSILIFLENEVKNHEIWSEGSFILCLIVGNSYWNGSKTWIYGGRGNLYATLNKLNYPDPAYISSHFSPRPSFFTNPHTDNSINSDTALLTDYWTYHRVLLSSLCSCYFLCLEYLPLPYIHGRGSTVNFVWVIPL